MIDTQHILQALHNHSDNGLTLDLSKQIRSWPVRVRVRAGAAAGIPILEHTEASRTKPVMIIVHRVKTHACTSAWRNELQCET